MTDEPSRRDPTQDVEVIVAGGGIAGLTMALTCHEIGVSVRVCESAPALRSLGLGISLQPAAVRELFDLGFESELASIGVAIDRLALVGPDGDEIWWEPRGLHAGYRWPQYSIMRGDLEMILYRAVLDRLEPGVVCTGARVVGYEHAKDGVVVDVAHDGSVERTGAAVLLGADGLHSAVRARMFPGEGGPRWGGAVLWRGATEAPPIGDGSSFLTIGNTAQRFITAPVSQRDAETGMQTQNWIAERVFDQRRGWRRGDWNTRVEVAEFIGHFDGWDFEWLDIPALIERTDVVFEYPMVDRDPIDHWVHGSVALIGDAAHAMYPVGSNGASQAIVDARVLGAAFVEHGVGRTALRAYETALHDEMNALIRRTRSASPAADVGVTDLRRTSVFDADDIPGAEVERFIAAYRSTSRFGLDEFNRAPSTIGPGDRVHPA
jgi:2-polyprenyl-6-methoxyphenol hydroxylase-like FAD-dependent oxidoreductase